MRVLITGGAGFAGSHLVEHLLVTTGWDLVVLDSLTYAGRTDRLTDSEYYDPGRVRLLWHDLRAPIHPHLDEQIGDVDAVLHLAAESHVDRSIADPAPFFHNNVAATLNLLEWARTRTLSHFVQVSTDEVYGPAAEGHRHAEWEPHIPSNPYAASKSAQEALAVAWWRTYDVPVVVTNTMNMFGERQHPEKMIPKTIRAIINGEPVTIHARRKGDGWEASSRHWLHARSHADALRWILHRPVTKYGQADRPDRWHIAGDEYDVHALTDHIADILGRSWVPQFVDHHSSRPGHDHRYALDPSKIHAAGWKPPLDTLASLERTVGWAVDHPEWLR